MEFPALGKNCKVQECHQLDFLPFICQFCTFSFCQHHFPIDSHNCNAVSKQELKTEVQRKSIFSCSFRDCIARDAAEMACIKCEQHYCLDHRFHNCFEFSNEEIEENRRKIVSHREHFKETQRTVLAGVSSVVEKCKSSKVQATAAKVQLMRLKGKAKGDVNIPASSRLYFNVYPPLRHRCPSTSIFVSKDWSVGRVIDAISSICKVSNKNNIASADKLRLFSRNDGSLIAVDMSLAMSNLVDSSNVSNGDSLILEYQNNDDLAANIRLNCFNQYSD